MEQQSRLEELERKVALLEEQIQRLSEPGVWRVQGVTVQDSEGRDRILLGAPTGRSNDRQRQDPATALIFLDERGTDRLVVGFVPDPQKDGEIKPRPSSAVGMVFNDQEGFERGGLGAFENGGAGLGLDHANGREAVSIFSMPKYGLAGVAIHNETGTDGVSLCWNSQTDEAHVRLPVKDGSK
jgi:hypothetical protein